MNVKDYQTWLNSKGQKLTVDGAAGPATREATKAVFSNPDAPAVTEEQLRNLAEMADVQYEQLVAVANVESSGGGYDSGGKPKMLFERHKFHSCTGGKYSTTSYSNPSAGGYNEDSWEKLGMALAKDVECAFKSASWGKFQIMGFWYPNMEFTSALDMAYATVKSEYHHYYTLVGYIRLSSLLDEMRMISTNPDDCRPFAKGYNGSNYAEGGYHEKIAAEMAKLT
jgi:hypothetical protein